MPMEGSVDKVFVIQGVANKLWATEDAMDTAIAQASTLLGGIVEARAEIGCSHIVTDPAMAKVSAALAAMAQARTALIESHAALDEAKLRLGVRTKLIGGNDKGDHHFASTSNQVSLRQAV
jgi:hypothetical protein